MNIYILGLIVPLLSFGLQVWPRLIKRYFGVDTWRWLLFADYVRLNKKLPEKSPKQFIAPAAFGYPPLIILLLALFPKKLLEKYQFVISPIMDMVNNYLIFLAAILLSGSVVTAILAQIIAALTPVIVIEASNMNTRILSYLIFTASFFSLVMYSLNTLQIYLLVSGVLLFLLFFTHRFAIQSYIASVIGMSLFERNAFYILFFLIILILVIILGGKLYRAILREHIASILYWTPCIKYRFSHQFRWRSNTKAQKDFIMKAYSLSPKIPVVFMLANNPWLLIVVPILLNLYFGWLPLVSTVPFDVQTKLGIWLISLVVWTSLVLGVKKLLIFGEGQRYLEYCILPISILIASYVPGLANRFGNLAYLIFGVVCVAMTGVIIFLQYKAVVKDRARSITKEVWQIIAYLNKQRSQVRLAMFPIQLGDAIVYFTKASILTSDLYSGLRQLSDLYPIIKKPLPEILKRYKINYVFFDRTFVELKELKINKYKIVLDLNNYVLLKV